MGTTRKKRLIILDSHAILHRAYHAIPNLTTAQGVPTGALFGLASMLLRVGRDLKPDYIIACRDLPGGTFRHEKFEQYKGTRGEAEDTLISQLQKAPAVFQAFGVPDYGAPGYEADDCIGTIVEQLRDRDDIEIVIATGDMDTLQLVNEQVSVCTFGRGISETILYDIDRVKERYGFGPEYVRDYKALRGDPSDNIPGIKGIGEKIATQLITTFGGVDDIYAALESHESIFEKEGIKPRIITLLKEGKTDAYLSKDLATIHTGVPIHFTLPEQVWSVHEYEAAIRSLFAELEFTSLATRLDTLVRNEPRPIQSTEVFVQTQAHGDIQSEDIDGALYKEAAVALWLLRSDIVAPTVGDILAATKQSSLSAAHAHLMKEIHASRTGEVYDTIEQPLIPIVERMHKVGIVVDVSYLQKLAHEYRAELVTIEQSIYRHAGHAFNVASPKQLGGVLYDELMLTAERQKKTATGARSTREEELLKMQDQHPIIDQVLRYRELSKLLSTYIEKIPEEVHPDGRLHARFLQAGTTTGRMSSESPNLQNIPIKTEYGRRIRTAFVATPGYKLVSLDYSQIELRIAAILSKDRVLMDVFTDGQDVHTRVASEVFAVAPTDVTSDMRRKAKVINFGILYGMGVNALRINLGGTTTRAQAAEYLDAYYKQFPKLREYVDETIAHAREKGYTETLFGRRRYFPGFKSRQPGVIAQAERMAINAPIQGTQADIIKLAMVKADEVIMRKYSHDSVRLLLQVHDELVYEIQESFVDSAVHDITQVMEQCVDPELLHGVPLVVDSAVGDNWGEL